MAYILEPTHYNLAFNLKYGETEASVYASIKPKASKDSYMTIVCRSGSLVVQVTGYGEKPPMLIICKGFGAHFTSTTRVVSTSM